MVVPISDASGRRSECVRELGAAAYVSNARRRRIIAADLGERMYGRTLMVLIWHNGHAATALSANVVRSNAVPYDEARAAFDLVAGNRAWGFRGIGLLAGSEAETFAAPGPTFCGEMISGLTGIC